MDDANSASGALLDRLVAHGCDPSHGGSEDTEGFLRCYYGHVDSGDLTDRTIDDLYGLACDHQRLAQSWTSGDTAIRVFNPRIEVDGWSSDHTVLMIVTDDLPFLVDSVTMEVSRLGLGIHLVVHPILLDHRSSDHGFVNPRDHPANGAAKSSFIAIEFDRQADPDRLSEIESHLLRVLGDVRAAVEDWSAMRSQMAEIAAGLDEDLPLPAQEIEEGRELLEWLADDHFILFGYREYVIEDDALHARAETGLGILRPHDHTKPAPRLLSEMAPRVRDRVREPVLINLTKAGSKATIHRASYMDYIGVKTFNSAGEVDGERRFLGLFTSEVYTGSAMTVPRVKRLVAEVVERAGFPAGGHDEKRLVTILESHPRDELLQMDVDELFETAMGIAGLQERRRVRVFARSELFGRFVTCLVYMPRDRYNTASRVGIQNLLISSYGGSSADWSTQITDSVLARVLFHVRVESGQVNDVDVVALEAAVEALLRDWDDDFADELVRELGEDAGVRLGRAYANAFPPEYSSSFNVRTAVSDVQQLEGLGANGELKVNVYREPGQPDSAFKLKLYRRGARVSLTSVMPSLTNLGVTVVDERPYEVVRPDKDSVWIYDFSLECQSYDVDFETAAALIEETFGAVWRGEIADDGFNLLVLGAGIGPREVGVLRAYSRYLQQTGIAYSQTYIQRTLTRHGGAARLLVELFMARFDPDRDDHDAAAASITESFLAAVDAITSLDEDRVLRRFHNLITSTTRTTCFQGTDGDGPPPYLAFKLDPTAIDDLPKPRPRYEIFSYSPRFEGVHLRAGSVARGGLRWSDRNQDYRTEVLGLVKAQMVKNAVIVPGGAKGGFVLKRPPSDPAAVREEVVECYKLFVSSLLDLTDNLVEGEVVPPKRTVRYDGDDTYLVVAADKGTATFSDIANELATDRGFWLGDAFASGGSNGYDHKAMGITARGAWESVKRHFRELGRDVQSEPFTAVGIGDMSGDVFGNGMMLSPHLHLVAAFDHRHIFIDPDPDPQAGFTERARLFELPRSSWADYDLDLLSEGGGVFERTAKSIELSPQARKALGLSSESLTPDELISGVLKAPVDLLWNGGIGTYIKASDEPHSEVGDKANDAIRVDARDVGAQVVGEGGNLGVTQLGRIEFARMDRRIYTDAIDNAAGVDCSDHEVNIKVLLDQVVAAGDLTDKQRNELLAKMTDEVALLVLTNNYNQTQALSTARVEAASMVDVHARYLLHLEGRDLIDRQLERLPDAEGMADRRQEGRGLTTPELGVLLAYTKNILNADLLASSVPDDDVFIPLLMSYFPSPLREQYESGILTHQLRREIVANRISNLVVDRGGTSMVYRLSQETSAPSHEIAAAHMAAWEIFRLDELSKSVNDLEDRLSVERQLSIHLAGRQLAERATRLLIRSRPYPFSTADAIADLAGPVGETIDHLHRHLAGSEQAGFKLETGALADAGIPEDLARRVASLVPSLAALDIVEISTQTGIPGPTVAPVHFAIADKLELNWLRDRILDLPRDSQWSSLARLTLRGDLYTDHRALTSQVVGSGSAHSSDPRGLVAKWMHDNAGPVGYFRHTIDEIRAAGPTDLTTLLVAAREVRNLISRTATSE